MNNIPKPIIILLSAIRNNCNIQEELSNRQIIEGALIDKLYKIKRKHKR